MMYSVSVFDRAGVFVDRESPDFASAIVYVMEMATRYPDKVIQVFNTNGCDYDSNGLNEAESTLVQAAIDYGKEAA